MTDSAMKIRTMKWDELKTSVEWARLEGWNPGVNDARCFHAADPDGFFIGEIDGEAVGCISGVRYGEDFGFIGFYIVRPEYRGNGYGIQLWAAAMKYVEGRVLGLDGVPDQQDNYRKSGFDLAYRNIRFEGSGLGDDVLPVSLRLLAGNPNQELKAYDRLLFGVEREAFLEEWLQQPGAVGLASGPEENLSGYGVIRPCHTGFKIGPLFADDAVKAETLLDALLGQAPAGAPVYFDTPEVNAAAVAMAEARGMTRVFETARMYRGEAPAIPLERLFGVTSFELG